MMAGAGRRLSLMDSGRRRGEDCERTRGTEKMALRQKGVRAPERVMRDAALA